MARILYGLSGGGHGHAIRALTIARHFAGHEFIFLSHGAGATAIKGEFELIDIPNPGSPVSRHRVGVADTLAHSIRVLGRKGLHLKAVTRMIEEVKPDVAITDYEYFVPIACRKMGVPCISIDHQHIVTCCSFPVPLSQMLSFLGAVFTARTFYSQASGFLVVSFFHPPIKKNSSYVLVHPILREVVLMQRPESGDHVVAYQGYSTFKDFLPFLKNIRRPVMVYGFDQDYRDDNLYFQRFSEDKMLSDLASCSYVICGGGHTLISEALYLGKPVMSFPVIGMFEQFLNASYVEKLGYGHCHTGLRPQPDIIESFESRLEHFQDNIAKASFCGNTEVFEILERFIKSGHFEIF